MKAPESIGQRAFDALTKYIINSGHDIKNWCKDRGFNKSVIYTWKDGLNPNSKYLAMMCDLGLDVTYILTGKTRADHNSSMVPVVRCKNCKYRNTSECPMDSQNPWYDTPPMGFCFYGERKEDVNENR